MKITIILLIATIMQVSATGFAQRVTLNEKKITLDRVFSEIRKQTGYDVLWESEKLKGSSTIDAQFKNASLEEVMNKCLEGKPLIFIIQENTVVIKEKEPSFLDRILDRFNAIDVRGRVVDEEGRPLPGATVRIKSSGKSVSTNAKGEFYLEKVEDGTILIISFIGYISKEVIAAKEMGTIVLEMSNSKLDEVQVIAYGTTTQRFNVGNVTSIKADEIEKQPITNPLLALQGKVPGLIIQQTTGISGGGLSIQIRGKNSLENGTAPLYIIDGVPISPTLLQGQGSNIFAGGNPLNYLNISNIESIDILKDADATAIYGSRGANGVILITTKTGKAGNSQIELQVSQGLAKVTNNLKMMNTHQYLEMRREAFRNDGIAPSVDWFDLGYAPDLMLWDTTRYTDWQKKFIGNTAYNANYQLGVSGGSTNLQYNIGSVYSKQNTVFIGGGSDKKVGANFSFISKSVNQKFQFRFSGNYLTDKNQAPVGDLSGSSFLAPDAPVLYNADGTLNWENSTWGNPLASLNNKFTHKARNLIANGGLSYIILSGLEVKTNFGYTNLDIDEVTKNPVTRANPTRWATTPRIATFTNNNTHSWIIEPQITYQLTKGNTKMDFLLGSTLQDNNSIGEIISGEGYTSDALLSSIKAAPKIRVLANPINQYRYMAFFGRANFNVRDKYLLNLTMRRDGSTRFGPDKRFANFGAVGAGWILSEEKAIKNLFNFLSFAKIRGSYGTTGNDQISDYRYLDLYESISDPYQGVQGLYLSKLFNADLEWEMNKKLEVGLELGFLKDRVLLSMSHYRNRSSNQLVDYVIPDVTGFSSILINWDATIQNSGYESVLTTQNVKTKDFSWSTSANISLQKNKLIAYPGLESSPYRDRLVIGESITSNRVFSYAGINSNTGVYQFYKTNGEITATPGFVTDQTKRVDVTPVFYGGLSNTLNYKNVELSFLFDFVKKKAFSVLGFAGPMSNMPVDVLDRWQKVGDQSKYQKFSQTIGDAYFAQEYFANSDGSFKNASYLKLRNVAASYTFSEKLSRKIGVTSARFFLHCQNLLTISNFEGRDPESASYFNIPPLFTLMGGFKLTL